MDRAGMEPHGPACSRLVDDRNVADTGHASPRKPAAHHQFSGTNRCHPPSSPFWATSRRKAAVNSAKPSTRSAQRSSVADSWAQGWPMHSRFNVSASWARQAVFHVIHPWSILGRNSLQKNGQFSVDVNTRCPLSAAGANKGRRSRPPRSRGGPTSPILPALRRS
jgi:hypothetical protein